MNKLVADLLKAVEESAATTMVLTRKASAEQDIQGPNGMVLLNTMLNDLRTHDTTAKAELNGDGSITVTTYLGKNITYIANKYGYEVPEENA